MVQPGSQEPQRHNLLWLSLAIAVLILAVSSLTWHAWLPQKLENTLENELQKLGFEDTHIKIHTLGPPIGRLGYVRAEKQGLQLRVHEIQAEYGLSQRRIYSIIAEGTDLQVNLFDLPDFSQFSPDSSDPQYQTQPTKPKSKRLPFDRLLAPNISLRLKADTWQKELNTSLEIKETHEGISTSLFAKHAKDSLNLQSSHPSPGDSELNFNLRIEKTEAWTENLENFFPPLHTFKPWGRQLQLEGRLKSTQSDQYAWAVEGLLASFTLGQFKNTFTARELTFGLRGTNSHYEQAWLAASNGRAQYQHLSAHWEHLRVMKQQNGIIRAGFNTLKLTGLPWPLTIQSPRIQTEPITEFSIDSLKGQTFHLLADSLNLPQGTLNQAELKFNLSGDKKLAYESKGTLQLNQADFPVSVQGFYAFETGILTPFFQLDATQLEQWPLPLPQNLPKVLISGRTAAAAALHKNTESTQWVFMLAMDQGELEIPELELTINGLNGDFSFDLLNGELKIPEQTLNIEKITYQDWTLTDISAQLGSSVTGPLGSSTIQANLFGGALTCTIDPIPATNNAWTILLQITNLDTAALNEPIPGISNHIEGTLSGEFPITVKNGNVTFQQGYLELTRNGVLHLNATPLGGILDQVTDSIMIAITQALKQHDLNTDTSSESNLKQKLENAVKTLQLDKLRIDFFDKDNPETPATAHIQGITRGDMKIPLVIDVNINDVNGQLTKELKTLIGLIQMLAGNKDGARKLVE